MTSQNFCKWLAGYIDAIDDGASKDQLSVVKKKLATVDEDEKPSKKPSAKPSAKPVFHGPSSGSGMTYRC